MARFPIENGYLFAHLPKTAGTSFRDSLLNVFGDSLYCDYGSDPTTNQEVLDYIHQRNDFFEFGSFLADLNKLICLSGHYPIKKYCPFFYMRNVILFLRDPIQRVISQYEHAKRVDSITESLESYCSKPNHMNLQSRNIGRVPFQLIGFLGLQEFYSESLALLRAQTGLQVQESFLNINSQRKAERYQPDEEMLAFLEKNNEKDLVLYKRAVKVFKQRYELFSNGKRYMHGAVNSRNKKRITGWVLHHHDELPVEVSISLNGEVVANMTAKNYRHDLKEWNVNRMGYVGFGYIHPTEISHQDKFICTVAENGQILFNSL